MPLTTFGAVTGALFTTAATNTTKIGIVVDQGGNLDHAREVQSPMKEELAERHPEDRQTDDRDRLLYDRDEVSGVSVQKRHHDQAAAPIMNRQTDTSGPPSPESLDEKLTRRVPAHR